jgi:hypothetical protein
MAATHGRAQVLSRHQHGRTANDQVLRPGRQPSDPVLGRPGLGGRRKARAVRAQLTRVYAKVGVRSQSALMALFMEELVEAGSELPAEAEG